MSGTRTREAGLARAALTDCLAGWFYRWGLSRRLPEIAQRIGAWQRIGLCLPDLDEYKAIRDAAVHEAGDRIRPTGTIVASSG